VPTPFFSVDPRMPVRPLSTLDSDLTLERSQELPARDASSKRPEVADVQRVSRSKHLALLESDGGEFMVAFEDDYQVFMAMVYINSNDKSDYASLNSIDMIQAQVQYLILWVVL
jgi:hypothetical protein